MTVKNWGVNEMFDFKFDWKKELEVGIPEIDEQHRELFRIVRDMEQLLITRCIGVSNQQLIDVVRQLREFVSYHFYEEEKVMNEFDYSLKEAHIASHNKMNEMVLSIDLPKLGEMPFDELKKIKDGTQDWIFEHMFNADKHMGLEIKEKMKQRQ
ncbi:MAG: hemerythrin domain-containing protein [bacterium]|nr:hemerythrin domain-containing protein [bacterium]